MFTTAFPEWVLFFIIYSFIGWVCEVIYCSIPAKKLVKRGFLAGPYCPIYGFGALALILFLTPISQRVSSIPIFYICAVIITSALEYFTSWLLEKLLGMHLWNYSHMKFNIKGRICLLNSILFGIMGIFLMYIVHPFFKQLILSISISTKLALASVTISILLLDLVTTINSIYKLENKVKSLWSMLKKLALQNNSLRWDSTKSVKENIDFLTDTAKSLGSEKASALIDDIKTLLEKDNAGKRILSSFNSIKHNNMHDQFQIAKQSYDEKRSSFKGKYLEKINKIKSYFKTNDKDTTTNKTPSLVSGHESDLELRASHPHLNETRHLHLARRGGLATGGSPVNFYKIVWTFFIASFVGYVVEMIYCIATRGIIESRQGLIYGPFSQVYGFGAIFMVIFLRRASKKNDRWVFFGGMVIGGLFEYICSFLQEKAFNSVSWDYEGQHLSLGGRTSLLYMFFWGVLAVVFIKNIYPKISAFVEKIPNKHGIIFSWIIVIFLSLDMMISALAVNRWSNRISGVQPQNMFEEFLDENYNNEYLEGIYPNMSFVHNNE